MIEKLEPIKCFNYSDTPQAKMQHHNYHNDCINKINKLVDAVNELQEDYDNVCIWVGEQKLKIPAKNIPEPIKLYVCADGSVYDNLDVAKSHAASIFNPLPAGATTTDRVYLEQELERTRKALDVAVNAMKSAGTHNSINCIARGEDPSKDDVGITINHALDQITALEQKESAFVHNKIEFPEYNDGLLEEFDKQFFENGQDDDLTETALEQKEGQ